MQRTLRGRREVPLGERWFALASRALTTALFHATTPRQPRLSQAQQEQALARATRSAPFRRSIPRGEPFTAVHQKVGRHQFTGAPVGNARGFFLNPPVFAGFYATRDGRDGLGRELAEMYLLAPPPLTGSTTARCRGRWQTSAQRDGTGGAGPPQKRAGLLRRPAHSAAVESGGPRLVDA